MFNDILALIFLLALFVLPSMVEIEIGEMCGSVYAQECDDNQLDCTEDEGDDSYLDDINDVCDSLQEEGYDCPNPEQEIYGEIPGADPFFIGSIYVTHSIVLKVR